jgi:ankyrin repeat protein
MGDARRVELFLAAGLDVDTIVNSNGETRLHNAARRVGAGPEAEHWNRIRYSELEVMRLLLARGADVNAKTWYGKETPLHLLLHNNWEHWWSGTREDGGPLKLLLQYGADVNAADSSEQSPLHYAAHFNNHKAASLLLEYGADVNKEDFEGKSALVRAVQNASPNMVAFLLERGADPHKTNGMKLNWPYFR